MSSVPDSASEGHDRHVHIYFEFYTSRGSSLISNFKGISVIFRPVRVLNNLNYKSIEYEIYINKFMQKYCLTSYVLNSM